MALAPSFRDFYINGEALVLVKGRNDFLVATTGLTFGNLHQLGLSTDSIRITPNFRHRDINVDAWGEAPADVQWMLADITISMNLIHFDPKVLDVCVALSMGGQLPTVAFGASAPGQMARAGTRLGGGGPVTGPGGAQAAPNNYIRLNIASPAAPFGRPGWNFPSAYLTGPPEVYPLGTEKSVVALNWRCIPYTPDPAGVLAGTIYGATQYQLFSYTLDVA